MYSFSKKKGVCVQKITTHRHYFTQVCSIAIGRHCEIVQNSKMESVVFAFCSCKIHIILDHRRVNYYLFDKRYALTGKISGVSIGQDTRIGEALL